MRVRCDCDSCINWKEDAGDYIGEGGCILDEIKIDTNVMTAAGFLPLCRDYKDSAIESYEEIFTKKQNSN